MCVMRPAFCQKKKTNVNKQMLSHECNKCFLTSQKYFLPASHVPNFSQMLQTSNMWNKMTEVKRGLTINAIKN